MLCLSGFELYYRWVPLKWVISTTFLGTRTTFIRAKNFLPCERGLKRSFSRAKRQVRAINEICKPATLFHVKQSLPYQINLYDLDLCVDNNDNHMTFVGSFVSLVALFATSLRSGTKMMLLWPRAQINYMPSKSHVIVLLGLYRGMFHFVGWPDCLHLPNMVRVSWLWRIRRWIGAIQKRRIMLNE